MCPSERLAALNDPDQCNNNRYDKEDSMSPPMVLPLTKPRIHKITRATKIAQSMLTPYSATKVPTSPYTTC